MSYKNLEIWRLADDLVVEIHDMTLTMLPKFEMFETGSQIRPSMKSVKSTIVEGYGRRKYKAEFIKFLIYALASNDETTDHLETLYKTKSLTEEKKYLSLHSKLQILGKKINLFIKGVSASDWNNTKPVTANQQPATGNPQPATNNQQPATSNYEQNQ